MGLSVLTQGKSVTSRVPLNSRVAELKGDQNVDQSFAQFIYYCRVHDGQLAHSLRAVSTIQSIVSQASGKGL